MKPSFVSLLSLACLGAASREGAPIMSHLMSIKTEHRERARAQGLFKPNSYIDLAKTPCVDGKAGEYSCENVDLLGFLSHQAMGSTTREGNDIWGMLTILCICSVDIRFNMNRMDISRWP